METLKIKKGTIFETVYNTLLVVTEIKKDCVVFFEFAYNSVTSEYDILIDKNIILTPEEIKDVLYKSFGKNYKIVIES